MRSIMATAASVDSPALRSRHGSTAAMSTELFDSSHQFGTAHREAIAKSNEKLPSLAILTIERVAVSSHREAIFVSLVAQGDAHLRRSSFDCRSARAQDDRRVARRSGGIVRVPVRGQIAPRDRAGMAEDEEPIVGPDVDDVAGNRIAAVINDRVRSFIVDGSPVISGRKMVIAKAIALSALG